MGPRPNPNPSAEPDRWRVPGALDQAAGWAWRFVAVTAAAYVLIWLTARLKVVVVSLFVAIVVAAALAPLVGWLVRRRVPRLVATWLAVLLVVAALAGALAFVIPRFVEQLDGVDTQVSDSLEQLELWLGEGPFALSTEQIDDLEQQIVDRVGTAISGMIPDPFAGVSLVAEALTGIFLSVVLSFYFLKDGEQMWGWFLSHADSDRRRRIDLAGQRAVAALRNWLRGVAVTGAFDGVAIGVALVIIGVPLAYALALLTFLAAFLPIVGALAAGVIAVLVALATNGPTDALIVAIVVVAVQQIEGDVIMPMVMSRSIALHPVAVLVALTAGGATAGIIGAIVAVPVTAAAVAISGAMREQPAPSTTIPVGVDTTTSPRQPPGARPSDGPEADPES